jgi:FkbH-like protein
MTLIRHSVRSDFAGDVPSTGAAGPGRDEALARVRTLLSTGSGQEPPTGSACVELAKAYQRAGDPAQALRWAYTVCDVSESLVDWLAATSVLRACLPHTAGLPRLARVAVLGSYTTVQFAALLPLAAARAGVAVEVYECGYGQYRQEILDPGSGLYAFDPDVAILATHAGELDLPAVAADPAAETGREVSRWTRLWDTIRERCGAQVVQHTFAVPVEEPLGHLAARTSGSRSAMTHALNARLGEAAGTRVALVDCERLASAVGKRTWFDARYWARSKLAVSLACVPLLARHTAAVVASGLGQSRKCLVLDLDNTLWGGVLSEDGLGGIRLGHDAVGEAYTAFQDYVLALKNRGVLLAVASKNNPEDAREAFQRHPDMRLTLDDIAVFSACWDDKATQLRRIASTLGIGLDSFVFVDDDPAEREVIRQLVPEVDVLPLPSDPAGYTRALADYPLFEPAALTEEDATRTEHYRARARITRLHDESTSLEAFLTSLDMVASVVALDDFALARVVQLMGKTNQFNLTGRRRGQSEVAALMDDPDHVVVCVRLRDRFVDHGLVGVIIGAVGTDGDGTRRMLIDTWLMSCRVIGRTLEHEMLRLLAAAAAARGCRRLVGSYVPTAKNALVADLYPRLAFQPDDDHRHEHRIACPPSPPGGPEASLWTLDVNETPPSPGYITINNAPREDDATRARRHPLGQAAHG